MYASLVPGLDALFVVVVGGGATGARCEVRGVRCESVSDSLTRDLAFFARIGIRRKNVTPHQSVSHE